MKGIAPLIPGIVMGVLLAVGGLTAMSYVPDATSAQAGSGDRVVDCSSPGLDDTRHTFSTSEGDFNYTDQELCLIAEYPKIINGMLLQVREMGDHNIYCFAGNATYLNRTVLSDIVLPNRAELEYEACEAMHCQEVYDEAYR